MNTAAFGRGGQFTALNRSQLQSAGMVHGVLPVAPDRSSLRFSDRAVSGRFPQSRAQSFASRMQAPQRESRQLRAAAARHAADVAREFQPARSRELGDRGRRVAARGRRDFVAWSERRVRIRVARMESLWRADSRDQRWVQWIQRRQRRDGAVQSQLQSAGGCESRRRGPDQPADRATAQLCSAQQLFGAAEFWRIAPGAQRSSESWRWWRRAARRRRRRTFRRWRWRPSPLARSQRVSSQPKIFRFLPSGPDTHLPASSGPLFWLSAYGRGSGCPRKWAKLWTSSRSVSRWPRPRD